MNDDKLLFEQLHADIARSIDDGVLRAGNRLPSLRETSRTRRLSITTVKRAYQLLESQGFIEGRPKSGYFVRMLGGEPICVTPRQPACDGDSAEGDVSRVVLSTLKAISQRHAARFGSPYPDFGLAMTSRRPAGMCWGLGSWTPMAG